MVFLLAGVSLTNINIITAQTDDFDSLCRMAKQAKVLLNCVGPVSGDPSSNDTCM